MLISFQLLNAKREHCNEHTVDEGEAVTTTSVLIEIKLQASNLQPYISQNALVTSPLFITIFETKFMELMYRI